MSVDTRLADYLSDGSTWSQERKTALATDLREVIMQLGGVPPRQTVRTPVAAVLDTAGALVVVCDDGTVWRTGRDGSASYARAGWEPLYTGPIPGTAADTRRTP